MKRKVVSSLLGPSQESAVNSDDVLTKLVCTWCVPKWVGNKPRYVNRWMGGSNFPHSSTRNPSCDDRHQPDAWDWWWLGRDAIVYSSLVQYCRTLYSFSQRLAALYSWSWRVKVRDPKMIPRHVLCLRLFGGNDHGSELAFPTTLRGWGITADYHGWMTIIAYFFGTTFII